MAWLDDFFWTYETLIHSLGINGLLGLSMYVVLACGQLSLGQAGFMGIGAYTGALLTLNLDAPFWLVLPAAAVLPALVAAVIGGPTLKLSGIYLAIATIALGEVLRIGLINAEWSGGALGLSGIPAKATSGVIFAALALGLAATWRLGRSRVGRAMAAMREDEVAAGVLGVAVPRYRLGALVASAGLAGVAGCLGAHSTSFIGPNDYGFETAVTILSYALLGGIGSPFGAVLGAMTLTALPEVLRPLADYRLVVNGVIIVAAVLFLPRGLLPWRMAKSA